MLRLRKKVLMSVLFLIAIALFVSPSPIVAEQSNSFSYKTDGQTATIYFAGNFPVISETAFQGSQNWLTFYYYANQGSNPSEIQGWPTVMIMPEATNLSIPLEWRIWLVLLIILGGLSAFMFIPLIYLNIKKNTRAIGQYRQLLALMIAGLLSFGLPGLLRNALKGAFMQSGSLFWQIVGFVFIFTLQAILGGLVFARLVRPAFPKMKIMRACLIGFPLGLVLATLIIVPFLIIMFVLDLSSLNIVPWWITALEYLMDLIFGVIAGSLSGLMIGLLLGMKRGRRVFSMVLGAAGLLTSVILLIIMWTRIPVVDGRSYGSDLFLSWNIIDLFFGSSLGLAIGLAAQKSDRSKDEQQVVQKSSYSDKWWHP